MNFSNSYGIGTSCCVSCTPFIFSSVILFHPLGMTFNPNLVPSANMKSMLKSWSHGPCLLSEWGWLYTVDMLVFFVFEFFYDANMLIALSFVSCDTFFWVHCLTQNRPICVITFQVMFSWFRCFQAVKPGMPFGESEACKACTSTYWMWWYMHFILFFFFCLPSESTTHGRHAMTV